MKQSCICSIMVLLVLPVLYAVEKSEKKAGALEKQLQVVTGEEKIEVLIKLTALFFREQPQRAANYGHQALELAERMNFDKGKARALIYLANAYRILGHVKKPYKYGQEALRIYENLGDPAGTVNSLNTLGYLNVSIDNYPEALKYLVKALDICHKMGYAGKKEGIYYQLGNLYLRLKDSKKAMEYYQKAFKSAESLGKQRRMALYLNNIGLVYRQLEQYPRALDYFKKAFNIFSRLENASGITAASGNLGFTYGELNDFPQALEYLDKAIKTAEENNNIKGISDNLTHLGYQYFKKKDYTRAGQYYEKALEIAKNITDNYGIQNIYKHFSDLYIAKNDYKKAMEYYIKYTGIKDKLVDEKKNRQLVGLQERYEAEKKTREIAILKKNNEIQRITRNVFIAGFALVLVILVFIFKKYLYLFAFWKKQKYIGQYRLIKTIGAGGMSTVFMAHCTRDKNEIAAIKVLKDEFSLRESTRKRFKQEGTIIDKLDHPNIVKIFTRGEYQERLFIVMEFLEGKTLAEKIETEGMFSLKAALPIMRQITAALAYIHRVNILHRDLKPGNIMITKKEGEKDVVKLLDFGLSRMKFQSRITMTGVLVGTATYTWHRNRLLIFIVHLPVMYLTWGSFFTRCSPAGWLFPGTPFLRLRGKSFTPHLPVPLNLARKSREKSMISSCKCFAKTRNSAPAHKPY